MQVHARTLSGQLSGRLWMETEQSQPASTLILSSLFTFHMYLPFRTKAKAWQWSSPKMWCLWCSRLSIPSWNKLWQLPIFSLIIKCLIDKLSWRLLGSWGTNVFCERPRSEPDPDLQASSKMSGKKRVSHCVLRN